MNFSNYPYPYYTFKREKIISIPSVPNILNLEPYKKYVIIWQWNTVF